MGIVGGRLNLSPNVLPTRVPASRVHSHEPAASTVSGNAYIYSNDEVAPFSKSNVRFHFEASSPLLVLESATRRVQLSHWTSKVEVTEDFILQHDGPGFVFRMLLALERVAES